MAIELYHKPENVMKNHYLIFLRPEDGKMEKLILAKAMEVVLNQIMTKVLVKKAEIMAL